MNDFREHDGWLDAAVAERLLSGQDIAEADSRAADLTRLLTVAAKPLPVDSAREHAALAAFRQARDSPVGRGLRRRTFRSRPVKVLAGGIAAVFVLGGVAIAAQTGNLPLPFHPGAATSGPVPSTATVPGNHGAVAPHPSGTPSSSAATGSSHTPVPPAQPSLPAAVTSPAPAGQDVKGLCEKYVQATDRGQSLESRSGARLEQAAGGKSEVDAYCARLLGRAAAHGKSPASPTPPSSRPTGPPTPRR